MTHTTFPAPAITSSFAPPVAIPTIPAPTPATTTASIDLATGERVGAHRRLVARMIDQAIGALGLALAVQVALASLDQRAYVRDVSMAACGGETRSNDVQKIAMACLDDPTPGHVTRFLIGQLPATTVLLLLVGIAAALLWQWPLARRGGTIGQRMVDLRHRQQTDRKRVAGVLLWRQASLIAPNLLVLMGAPLWLAIGSVAGLLVEGWVWTRRLTVTERIVGPVVEAPRRRAAA